MDIDSKKLIVFDLDGTLFFLKVDWGQVSVEFQSRFGHSLSSQLLSPESQSYLSEIERVGVEDGYSAVGALTLLRELNSRGKSIAVVSRNLHKTIEHCIKKIGFEQPLLILGRDDVKKLKPNPEGLEAAILHAKVQSHQTLFVGDTYHDVDCAKAKNVDVLIIRNPNLEFIPKGADEYLDSLTELLC